MSDATCIVQVRDDVRAPWRAVPPSCRIAVALQRALELVDQFYPAVRVVQDGSVIYEWPSAPADGDQACPQRS